MISQDYIQLLKRMQENELRKMLLRQKEDIIGEAKLNTIFIEECDEQLVNIVDYVNEAIISMTEMRQRFADETLYVRKTIAEQLSAVASQIYPYKLKFFDAFRPIELQQKWFDTVYNDLQAKNPHWNEEKTRAEAFFYIFPSSWNLQTPPPHSTGAAIDLTIVDKNGIELDMGTKYAEFDNPLIYTNAVGLSNQQKQNRNLLLETMLKNSFVNYPAEWWHYSLGDREWIAYLDLSLPAIYGRTEDPYPKP